MSLASPPSATRSPAPDRMEIQRKLSSAGRPDDSRGRDRRRPLPVSHPPTTAGSNSGSDHEAFLTRAKSASTSPHSTDTDSDAPAGLSSPFQGNIAGHANLSAISEADTRLGDDYDSDDEDREERERWSLGLGWGGPGAGVGSGAGWNNEESVMSGYLEKKGERRKAWKRRWFVLRKTTLVYYKNDKEYRLLRMIPLSEIRTCAEVQVKSHCNTFGIVTPLRTYYVRAKSRSDMEAWVTSVVAAQEELQRATRAANSRGESTPSGVATPTGPAPQAAPPTAQATLPITITIPGSSSDVLSPAWNPQSLGSPSAYSSPTGMGGAGGELSSSYASQSSAGFSHQESLAVPDLDPSDTDRDRQLERLSLSAAQSPHRASLTNQPGWDHAPAAGLAGDPGYFAHSRRASGGFLRRGPSGTVTPGGVMSSSDEEDEYEADVMSSPIATERKGPMPVPEAGKTILEGYLMKQGKRKTWRKRYFVLTSSKLVYLRSHMDKGAKPGRQIPVARILDAIECHDDEAKAPSSPLTGQFHFPTHPSHAHHHHHHHPSAPPRASAGAGAGAGFGVSVGVGVGAGPSTGPPGASGSEGRHCFRLITSQRTYLVAAPTEEDEIRWLSALKCLLAARRPSAGGAPAAACGGGGGGGGGAAPSAAPLLGSPSAAGAGTGAAAAAAGHEPIGAVHAPTAPGSAVGSAGLGHGAPPVAHTGTAAAAAAASTQKARQTSHGNLPSIEGTLRGTAGDEVAAAAAAAGQLGA